MSGRLLVPAARYIDLAEIRTHAAITRHIAVYVLAVLYTREMASKVLQQLLSTVKEQDHHPLISRLAETFTDFSRLS